MMQSLLADETILTLASIITHGGRIVDVATGKMACNTAEAKAGLSYWTKLIKDGLAAPGGHRLTTLHNLLFLKQK